MNQINQINPTSHARRGRPFWASCYAV